MESEDLQRKEQVITTPEIFFFLGYILYSYIYIYVCILYITKTQLPEKDITPNLSK